MKLRVSKKVMKRLSRGENVRGQTKQAAQIRFNKLK